MKYTKEKLSKRLSGRRTGLKNTNAPLKRAVRILQSTPDNSNLQGNSKTVRVIGNSKKIAEGKVKNSFYCTVNILITFSCRNVT